MNTSGATLHLASSFVWRAHPTAPIILPARTFPRRCISSPRFFLTNGSITTSSSFFIGYPDPVTINGTTYTNGSPTVTNAIVNENGQVFFIGRTFGGVAGNGTLTVLSNATINVGTTASHNLTMCFDNASASEAGAVNIFGGTLNVASSSTLTSSQITFFQSGAAPGETACIYPDKWYRQRLGGIAFGPTARNLHRGSCVADEFGWVLLNIGQPRRFPWLGPILPSFNITLSGGIVGALANWSSALPITLATLNGNITFPVRGYQ